MITENATDSSEDEDDEVEGEGADGESAGGDRGEEPPETAPEGSGARRVRVRTDPDSTPAQAAEQPAPRGARRRGRSGARGLTMDATFSP
jgi:hypothetical protein